jgi:2-polyprenyl-6-methoxyphenol hydroxylase-like FAD-dependent oxidoreductase
VPVARVVVVGAGVGGLGSALALGRRGHQVTVLERDHTPLPSDPHEAFAWDRRGAPQVRHSHAFLARLRNLLRDRHPDVLAMLLDVGATELRFAERLPDTLTDTSPRSGDEDLVALACRRTTFEWVLRRCVLGASGVELRDGVTVHSLATEAGRVVGVGTGAGDVVRADLVVLAAGPRCPTARLVTDAGLGEIEEEVEDTGIVYWSRFYRLRDGAEPPPQEGPIGADLGYLKFAVFQGDNGTFSVTLATHTDDRELRAVARPDAFDATAALMQPVAPWVDPAVSEAVTDVHPMARLVNRTHRFVRDGEPVTPGLVAVGDAHTCTNPLYGRGCSLAMVQAELLADALASHDGDLRAATLAYEEATEREVLPWYRSAVAQDRMDRVAAGEDAAGPEASGGEEAFMRSILRDGLFPAARVDPLVFRAFLRTFNLLQAPESVMQDPDVLSTVMQTWQTRDQRPPEPALGPDRAHLLSHLPT